MAPSFFKHYPYLLNGIRPDGLFIVWNVIGKQWRKFKRLLSFYLEYILLTFVPPLMLSCPFFFGRIEALRWFDKEDSGSFNSFFLACIVREGAVHVFFARFRSNSFSQIQKTQKHLA